MSSTPDDAVTLHFEIITCKGSFRVPTMLNPCHHISANSEFGISRFYPHRGEFANRLLLCQRQELEEQKHIDVLIRLSEVQ